MFEESLHKRRTRSSEHPGGDCGPRMKRRSTFGKTTVTAFWIGRTVNNAAYLRPSQGSGTHQARLHGDVECAPGQILSSKRRGSCRNGLHLGMSRYIGEGFGKVVTASHNPPAGRDYDGPDGHFAGLKGSFGLLESQRHIALVGCGGEGVVGDIHGVSLRSRASGADASRSAGRPSAI